MNSLANRLDPAAKEFDSIINYATKHRMRS